MPKLSPKQRWERQILERIAALKASGEIEKLRLNALAALGRRRPYENRGEWDRDFHKRATTPAYREWLEKECKPVSQKFGLDEGFVAMECLFEGFEFEEVISYMAVETQPPRIRVISESTDPEFLVVFSYEAQKLGLMPAYKSGNVEIPLVNTDLSSSAVMVRKPSAYASFYVRVETPPGYPPEAAQELHKTASTLERELRRRLGYQVQERVRSSSLVREAKVLKVSEKRLPKNAIYDIVDDTYGDKSALLEDQRKRNVIKSRRTRLRKRLTTPYNDNPGSTPLIQP